MITAELIQHIEQEITELVKNYVPQTCCGCGCCCYGGHDEEYKEALTKATALITLLKENLK